MKPRRVVFLGPPGVGKGTQATRAAVALGVPQVATGDMFREARSANTALGREVKGCMDRGALVPDAVVIRMVDDRLARPDCATGVVLDGFPRNVSQAEALDRILADRKVRLDRVLALDAPEATILERLGGRRTCGKCQAPYHVRTNPPKREGVCDRCGGALVVRPDDRPETIQKRLSVYRAEVRPLTEHYRRAGLLREVAGGGGVDEVARHVADALG